MAKTKKNRVSVQMMIVSMFMVMIILIAGILFFRLFAHNLGVDEQGIKSDIEYQKHYAFIVGNRNDQFWLNVYQEAQKKGKELGIYVELTGSQLSGNYDPNDLMLMAIASGVDGIIVNPVDERCVNLIETAAANGIDVETVLNDTIGGSRICFVGVGNYKLGQEYGAQIEKVANGLTKKVLVLIDSDDSSNQNLVYSSIKEYLQDTNLEVQNIIIDHANAFSAEEAIRNIVLKTELIRPDIMVCLSSLNTECAYQSIVDYNQVGQIEIIGYHGSAVILEAIEKRIIDSVIIFDGSKMGASGVAALDEYQRNGRVNEYIVMDTRIIDGSNINQYRQLLNGEE